MMCIKSGWFKARDYKASYGRVLRKCAMRGWTIVRDTDRIQRELNRVALKLAVQAKAEGGDAA
ncbi:MAG TPA: hypothetical protein GXX40_05540 [Firmicutes bacterium]|nr:hypothetical protein [Bacillota bacterium]